MMSVLHTITRLTTIKKREGVDGADGCNPDPKTHLISGPKRQI